MNFEEDIQQSLKVLRAGGIILYPTDTIWGIGCDATNEEAVEKIYRLKQRPDNKSMIVLLAGQQDLLRYVSALDMEVFRYLDKVQKPTTIIFEGAIGLANNLINKDGSIGIRIVQEEFCKCLLKRFGKPVVSTSANVTGQPSPQFFGEIDSVIRNGVDYCVKHRQDDISSRKASSVVRWNKDGTTTVIRP